VDLALCGPKNLAQLQENLAGLEKGALSPEEDTWMREFGRVVHG
jgi:aryl-alcohol dehydrogenase-like predicted oxidoreductase